MRLQCPTPPLPLQDINSALLTLEVFVYGEKSIGLIDFSYSHIIVSRKLCLMRKRKKKSIDEVTIRCIEAVDFKIGDGMREHFHKCFGGT